MNALTLHNFQRLNSTKIIPLSYTVLYRSMYCKMRNIASFLDVWNSLYSMRWKTENIMITGFR